MEGKMGVEKGKNWEGKGRAADGEEEVDKVELGKVYKVEGVERVAIFFSAACVTVSCTQRLQFIV